MIDEGYTLVYFFLDWKKAFDCIEREFLSSKLFMCGSRGLALNWFRPDLSSRKKTFVSIKITP